MIVAVMIIETEFVLCVNNMLKIFQMKSLIVKTKNYNF